MKRPLAYVDPHAVGFGDTPLARLARPVADA